MGSAAARPKTYNGKYTTEDVRRKTFHQGQCMPVSAWQGIAHGLLYNIVRAPSSQVASETSNGKNQDKFD